MKLGLYIVNLGPSRGICQDRIKHAGVLLGGNACRKGNGRELGESPEFEASQIARKKEGNKIGCKSSRWLYVLRKVWQRLRGVLEAKSTKKEVPCFPETGN